MDVGTSSGDLEGRLALITGGTSGVGLATASRLAQRGCRIVLAGRTRTKGGEAVASLGHLPTDVYFEQADMGDPDNVRELLVRCGELGDGRLDFLVSAGAEGSVSPRPFEDMTLEEVASAFETRLYPRIYPVRAAIPALKAAGGSIVMLATDAARHATPGESVMGAVGAGVILMTKALGKELSRSGVRVNCVAMTLTSGTPSWDRIFSREDGFESELFKKAAGRFPQGRPPHVEEVAAMVTHLVADAPQVTGQTVSVNGGLSFGGW